MKVLGKRANMCLFIYPLLFVVCIVVFLYFWQLIYDYDVAITNDDFDEMFRLKKLIEKYTITGLGRRRFGFNPVGYTIYSLCIAGYSIYAFNRRLVQPRVLIECDDKGFYLNLPFNKTWYVLYEEILCIDIRKSEDMLKIPKWIYRSHSGYKHHLPSDPDGYLKVTGSTFGILKTGTIVVGLRDRTIKVHGVKNAFEVAKQMQVICNDGKRKRNEWLDEKKREQELKILEKREQELREKTKT